MKSKSFKKIISSAIAFLLVLITIFSVTVPPVFAQENIFTGTGALEVYENETVDLLQGVEATNSSGENLQVSVASVKCETNGNYQYDDSGSLNVGEAGSIYHVKYEAILPENTEEIYTTTRKITAVSKSSEDEIAESEIEEEGYDNTTVGTEEESHDSTTVETEEESHDGTTVETEEESHDGTTVETEEESHDGTTVETEEESHDGTIVETEPTEETIETNTDEEIETSEPFDENQLFTITELEGMGYSVQMDGARIPIEYFELECLPADEGSSGCEDLHFIESLSEIEGGKIQDHVPYYVKNQVDQNHSYLKAHVGNVNVYYIGTLHIYNDHEELDYIYYTTDKYITNKTVYAVLRPGEKIKLQYKHDSDYKVDYEIINEATGNEENIGGWTIEDVFGADRAYSVKKGEALSIKVKIPRGYQADIYYIEKKESEEHLKDKIGYMISFQRDGKDPNKIVLKPNSPAEMIYRTSFNLQGITDDIIIKLKFKKVETIHFDAFLWSQTDYAKGRIQVHPNETPNEQNTKKTVSMPTGGAGASFTWEWDGVTSMGGDDPQIDQGSGQPEFHTWELDKLEINDETLLVPMIPLSEKDVTRVAKTRLKSGTIVTLSVTSKGGENAYQGRRHYKLEVSNCYEDITISGGNMVGHRHKEYIIHELSGVFQPGYYAATELNGGNLSWNEMHADTKIAKIGFDGKNKWTDPFRFQRHVGFYKPDISFTTKDGVILQHNNVVELDPDRDKKEYIQYLNRLDSKTNDKQEIGEYEVVSYSEWEASSDGYYYFRGTKEVEEFVGDKPEDAPKGVILININAYPFRIGMDYQNGADKKGIKGPRKEDIINLPATQYGGNDGYNALNNPRLLMSNQVPVDKKNKFVFDHWEVLRTESNSTPDGRWGYLTDEVKTENDIPIEEGGKPYTALKGEEFYLDTDLLTTLEHCFYLKADPGSGDTDGNPFDDEPHKGAQTHAIVTVRAVWREYKEEPTIPYIVRYILANVENGQIDVTTERLIEQRAHTVNKGAKLVSDLYQDGNKTLSASIQNILKGENRNKKDYTDDGNITWIVYEPKTTKVIESVDEKNNIATIYLIQSNTKINVEKKWTNSKYQEEEVTVQLQRRKEKQDSWEKVDNVILNDKNQWKHSFDVEQYYDLSQQPLKSWLYRVVEVNQNGTVMENGQNILINGNNYQVDYQYDEKTNSWIIRNTHMQLLDLTISKEVKGNSGDYTKEFIFDIQATDQEGRDLNGTYSYIGNVKLGYENQIQKPNDGKLSFHDGVAQIELKHGQQILIQDLPENAKITVTEKNGENYQISYIVNGEKKNLGDLILTMNSSIDVVNELNSQVIDPTDEENESGDLQTSNSYEGENKQAIEPMQTEQPMQPLQPAQQTNPPKSIQSANTGDTSNYMVYLIIAVVSLVLIIVLLFKDKRNHKK